MTLRIRLGGARTRALVVSVLSEGASGFLPLLIVPVLITRLGADTYALTLPPLALAGLLVSTLDLGLTIGLPPLWMKQRRPLLRARYLIAATLLKMTACMAAGAFFLLAWLVSHPDSAGLSWLGAYLVMIGQTMYPNWAFIIAGRTMVGQALSAGGKLLPIIVLFVFLHTGHPSGFVNLALGLGAVVAAALAHYVVLPHIGASLHGARSIVRSSLVLTRPLASRHRRLWIAQLTQSVYRTTLPVIAATALAPAAFLAFSVSEKCLRACQSVQAFVLQFDFSRLLRSDSGQPIARRLLDGARRHVLPISFLLSFAYYFAFKQIAPLIFAGNGPAIREAFDLHPILTSLVVIGGLNYWLGALGLGAMQRSSSLLAASAAAAAVAMLSAGVASFHGSASAFALSMASGEIVFLLIALVKLRSAVKSGN